MNTHKQTMKKNGSFLPAEQILAAALLAAALTACPQGGGGGGDAEQEPVLPPAITGLSLEAVAGENAFTASWEEPEPAPEGISYELFYTEQGETPPSAPSPEASGFPADRGEITISNLSGGKAYSAWVRSVLESGKGPWSEGASITLLRDQTGITFSIQVFGQTRFAQVLGNDLKLQVPINTPRPWRFTPDIALAEGASLAQDSSPGLEQEADFGDPEHPVSYRVLAENGREQVYTVRMEAGDESGLGFSLEPPEDLLGFTGTLSLSKSGQERRDLVIKNAAQYQNCAWYVDGLLKSTGTGLRLRAADYAPGVHYLSVNGFITYNETDQVPWSTELIFTVTE
jgi:hypothetical protein